MTNSYKQEMLYLLSEALREVYQEARYHEARLKMLN